MWRLFRSFFARIVVGNIALVMVFQWIILPELDQWYIDQQHQELSEVLVQAKKLFGSHDSTQWSVWQQEIERTTGFWTEILPEAERPFVAEFQPELLRLGVISDEQGAAYLMLPDSQVLEILHVSQEFYPVYMDVLTYLLLVIGLNSLLVWLGLRQVQTKLQNLLQPLGVKVKNAGGDVDLLAECGQLLLQLQQEHQQILDQRQASNDDQRDLLHGVAHEFRAPLAKLRFAVDMLPGMEQQPDVAIMVDKSICELDSLMAEILRFSKLQHGQVELNLESVILSELVQELVTELTPHYPQVHFHFDTYDPTEISTDSELLSRALMNLLRNAARFARTRVDIHWGQGRPLPLTIADDGDGIPPGKRERIFEPFTRLDNSRSKDSGGVGLGLAIVRSILNKLDLEIEVTESQYGGACFRLNLHRNSSITSEGGSSDPS